MTRIATPEHTSAAPERPARAAPWRPLTRRAFVGALAAAAAAIAIDDGRGMRALGDCDDDRPRRHSTTVWIGHC
jgi:hypothetical protein